MPEQYAQPAAFAVYSEAAPAAFSGFPRAARGATSPPPAATLVEAMLPLMAAMPVTAAPTASGEPATVQAAHGHIMTGWESTDWGALTALEEGCPELGDLLGDL